MNTLISRRTIALAAACLSFASGPAFAVSVAETAANGFEVYQYTWTDSHGLKRSVALKKEGSGNSGHGGYAVRFIYRYLANGVTKTKTVNPGATNDGFGYFVSHERYRAFTDGTSATIAEKIFHKDDSPLGRGFPVAFSQSSTPTKKIAHFKLTYYHYGTVAANGLDPDTGNDKPKLGTAASLFKKYDLPVDIYWYFQDGTDHPRIRTIVHLNQLPGPDRVSFDLRGPYGKLDFDGGNGTLTKIRWGDSRHFTTTKAPVTRNATWTWSETNRGARYSSLMIGDFEMGLVEPKLYTASATNDGYAEGRGKTSTTYDGGHGCSFQNQLLPCDYEWPYQSAQYELPYDDPNGTTTSEKMAWGSTPFYGTSLTSTWDGLVSHPFVGFPASGKISYDVCLVLGPTATGIGLARAVAEAGGTYNCADTTRN